MALHMTITEDEDPPNKEFSIHSNFLFTNSQRMKVGSRTLVELLSHGLDHSNRFEHMLLSPGSMNLHCSGS